MNGIQTRAMLVRLSVSMWTARRYDKKVSDKAAQDFKAGDNAGRYNKMLVAQDAIAKIQKIVGEARDWHYTNTLPWQDDGQRILPAANYLKYTQAIATFRSRFDEVTREFIDSYPSLVEDAKIRLGEMYNVADYPNLGTISEKFAFDVVVSPIPSANDFRVNLNSSEIQRIQDDIEKRSNLALNAAVKDLWERVREKVAKMQERLSSTDAVFRNSLVDNMVEMVELLPRLNLTNDPELEIVRKEIESKLCSFNPQTLREDEVIRGQVAESAQEILDRMSGYCGGGK